MQTAVQAQGIPPTPETVRKRADVEPVWTAEMVEERLAEFFNTLARLPDTGRPAGVRAYWPDMMRNRLDVDAMAVEKGRYEDMTASEGPPDPDAIDRMDATLPWFAWLSRREIYVIRARLQAELNWWVVAGRARKSERTVQRWFHDGVAAIVFNLEQGVDKSDKIGRN